MAFEGLLTSRDARSFPSPDLRHVPSENTFHMSFTLHNKHVPRPGNSSSYFWPFELAFRMLWLVLIQFSSCKEAGSQTPTPQESLEPCMGEFWHFLTGRISGSQNVWFWVLGFLPSHQLFVWSGIPTAVSFEAISASAMMSQQGSYLGPWSRRNSLDGHPTFVNVKQNILSQSRRKFHDFEVWLHDLWAFGVW